MKKGKNVYLAVAVLLGGVLLSVFLYVSTASAQPTRGSEQQVTITMWHAYVGDRETFINDLISEFEGEYYTITVQTEVHSPSLTLFDDLVDTVKSGGETPDLAIGFPNQMWNLARFDALRFLDDLAADPSVGISLTDFYTGPIGEARLPQYGNQLGGLPLWHSAVEVLFYNGDLLAAEGMAVPQTWDEFYTACVSLTTETVSGTVLRTNYTQFINLIWTRGGEPYSPDLKRAYFNRQPGIDSMHLYLDLMEGGYGRMAEYAYEEQTAFGEGRAAFIMGGSNSIPYVRAAVGDAGVVNDWGVAPLPALPGQKAILDTGQLMMLLRSTVAEERAAWKFLRWFSLKDQNARLAAQMDYYPARLSAATHVSITEKLAADPQYAQAFQLLGTYGRNQTILLPLMEVLTEMRDAVEAILYDGEPITPTLDAAAADVDAILAMTGPEAATILPAGGVLVYSNTLGLTSTVVFPPGALLVTETVAYVPLSDLSSDGLSFALVPNMVLSQPVTATIHYRDEDVAGMDESHLKLYNYDWENHAWVDADPCEGYVRDLPGNKLTAIVCHFSDYSLVDRPYQLYVPLVLKGFEP